MRKRKHISLLILSLIAMITHSCSDDNFYIAEGTEMKFTINVTPQIPGEESRAVLSPEENINRYCFLYFDGKSSDSKLIYSRDILPTEMPFYTMLPGPGTNNTYAALLLANVTLADLGDPDPAEDSFTLGDLVNKTITIDNLYNKPTSNTNFTWSGYLDVTTASNSLNFVVNPNMAKLTMTFDNTTAEAEVVNVRMRKIPNKVGLAQNALNQAGITTAISGVTYIDYDLEDFSVTEGNSRSDAWYMPQNMQGTKDGGRLPTGGNLPPTDATYLEFDVLSSAFSAPLATAYKMYPGINTAKVDYSALADFNVKSGIIYQMTAQITSDGITGSVGNGFAADNKNAVAKIKLPTGTNCYMIHPLGDRITSGNGTLYELPIDRVNEYWQGVKGGSVANTTIDDDTEWTVDVIWQDIPTRAITFCDEYGNGTNINSYSGKGKEPFYFRLVDTDVTAQNQTYGNIVVGLKRNDNSTGYLWSWHLWITDYNPDGAPLYTVAKSSINTLWANMLYAQNDEAFLTKYTTIDLQGGWWYTADGGTSTEYGGYFGNVQHYYSLYSAYWGSTNPSRLIWDTGAYANKWVMDRNVGAQGPNNLDMVYPLKAWGLYYQYGRKDPFSYNYIYDIDGNRIYPSKDYGAQWEVVQAQASSINDGIQYPNRFYASDQVKWAKDASSNSWYSPTNVSTKTIFDPCPKGWRLAKLSAFYFGKLSNSTSILPEGYSSSSTSYTNNHVCFSLTIDMTSTYGAMKDKWRNFALLQGTGSFGSGDNKKYRDIGAVFPMQGYIAGNDGTMTGISTTIGSIRGCLWGADAPVNDNNAPIIQMQVSGDPVLKHQRQRGRYASYYNGGMTLGTLDGVNYDGKNWPTPRGQNVRCVQE